MTGARVRSGPKGFLIKIAASAMAVVGSGPGELSSGPFLIQERSRDGVRFQYHSDEFQQGTVQVSLLQESV